MKSKYIALFFYSGALTSAQVLSIEAYHRKGGYVTNFRRIPQGYEPSRDVIEQNFSLIGGEIPSTYDRFKSDKTKTFDTTDLDAILSGEATPPTASSSSSSSSALASDETADEKTDAGTKSTAKVSEATAPTDSGSSVKAP